MLHKHEGANSGRRSRSRWVHTRSTIGIPCNLIPSMAPVVTKTVGWKTDRTLSISGAHVRRYRAPAVVRLFSTAASGRDA